MLKVRVKHFLLAFVLSFTFIVLLGFYDASARPASMGNGESEMDDDDNGTINDDKRINSLQRGYQKSNAWKRTSDSASETARVIKETTEEKKKKVVEESNRLDASSDSEQTRVSSAQGGVRDASLSGAETSQRKSQDLVRDATLTGAYPAAHDSKDAVALPRDGLTEAPTKDPKDPKDPLLPVGPRVNETSRDLLAKVSPLVNLPKDEHWPLVLQPSGGEVFDKVNLSRYQPEVKEDQCVCERVCIHMCMH